MRSRWIASGASVVGRARGQAIDCHRGQRLGARSQGDQAHDGAAQKKGLPLYVLPPYSPELNRIEILWRKLKYEWLAFKTRDSKILETDLDDIFAKFGEHYRLTF
jgi:transposase